jgi:hypothetical protein
LAMYYLRHSFQARSGPVASLRPVKFVTGCGVGTMSILVVRGEKVRFRHAAAGWWLFIIERG